MVELTGRTTRDRVGLAAVRVRHGDLWSTVDLNESEPRTCHRVGRQLRRAAREVDVGERGQEWIRREDVHPYFRPRRADSRSPQRSGCVAGRLAIVSERAHDGEPSMTPRDRILQVITDDDLRGAQKF